MSKIVIGILPTLKLNTNDNPYDDCYQFIDMYSKKIIECGAIPIGILMNNGKLEPSVLELCDAFLLPGGKKAESYAYETIYYAITHNKPVLGICLGMQEIAIFSLIWEKLNEEEKNNLSFDRFYEIYKELKAENEDSILNKLDEVNIHYHVINRENKDSARHNIIIKDNTILRSIYNTNEIGVVSLHSMYVPKIGKDFIVSAYSTDSIIEAIEYKNKDKFIIGVQFHPEIEDDNKIFNYFINAINKY